MSRYEPVHESKSSWSISQGKGNEKIHTHTHTQTLAPMMLAERSRWRYLPVSQLALICYLSLLFPGRCSPALRPLLLLVLYCIHIHFPPILLQLGGCVSHDWQSKKNEEAHHTLYTHASPEIPEKFRSSYWQNWDLRGKNRGRKGKGGKGKKIALLEKENGEE